MGAVGDPDLHRRPVARHTVVDIAGIADRGQVIVARDHGQGLRMAYPGPCTAQGPRADIGIIEAQTHHPIQRRARRLRIGQTRLARPIQPHGHQVHHRPGAVAPAGEDQFAGVHIRALGDAPDRRCDISRAFWSAQQDPGANQGQGHVPVPAARGIAVDDESPPSRLHRRLGVHRQVGPEATTAVEQDHRRPDHAIDRPIGGDMRLKPRPALLHRIGQCRNTRVPVKAMAIPFSSAAAITSSSRIEPPGWITLVAPAATASSRPSANGKKASDAQADPSASE